MRKGIAHFDCTSGWTGNIGLAGHNRGSSASFAKLKDVQIGDGIDAPAAADYRTGGRCVAGLRIARSRVGVGSARRQRTRVSLCMAAQMTTGLAQAAEYYYDGGEAENVTAYYDGENAGREYFYSGENSGETFHQPTSTDQNSIANNGQIVIKEQQAKYLLLSFAF